MGKCVRETLDLAGWWHVWYDEAADWRAPGAVPSAGWEAMEWGKESQPVPGTWGASRPGYRGVAWYWRPVAVPEAWGDCHITLHVEGVHSQASVYLDECWLAHIAEGSVPCEIDLSACVVAGGFYTLALRVAHPPCVGDSEAGGITGAVSLLAEGAR
jgi:hypothetical protein